MMRRQVRHEIGRADFLPASASILPTATDIEDQSLPNPRTLQLNKNPIISIGIRARALDASSSFETLFLPVLGFLSLSLGDVELRVGRIAGHFRPDSGLLGVLRLLLVVGFVRQLSVAFEER